MRRGTLGIYVQNLTPDLAGAFDIEPGQGVLVAEIVADSAALDAGLQPGDVIVRMGKQDINSAQDFYNAEGRLALGDSLRVEYLREGKSRKTSLVIQSLPFISGDELDYRLKGARFVELTAKQKQRNISGVLLDELAPRSRLSREGLEAGDIIIGVARQRVRNLTDFKEAVEGTRGSILLQIDRGGRTYIARID